MNAMINHYNKTISSLSNKVIPSMKRLYELGASKVKYDMDDDKRIENAANIMQNDNKKDQDE